MTKSSKKNFHNQNPLEKESRKYKKYIKFKMVYAIISEKKKFFKLKVKKKRRKKEESSKYKTENAVKKGREISLGK